MKHKKISLLGLIMMFVLIAACGSTEERAGAKEIAEKNKTAIEKTTKSLEKYEELEEEMMTALSTDLEAKNAVNLLNKQSGAVGKNFKAREKANSVVEKQMKQINDSLETLIDYQHKNAVDVPVTELTQAIQTLEQLNVTYTLFDTYYKATEKAEIDFYQSYAKDITKEELAKSISTINQTHGAAYQQLEVLYADLSSALVAMTNLSDAIDK